VHSAFNLHGILSQKQHQGLGLTPHEMFKITDANCKHNVRLFLDIGHTDLSIELKQQQQQKNSPRLETISLHR